MAARSSGLCRRGLRELLDMSESNSEKQSSDKPKLGILQVVYSVLAAMIGVQNHKRHERDFEQGDPTQFIVIGILFVACFVFSLIWIVNTVLENQ